MLAIEVESSTLRSGAHVLAPQNQSLARSTAVAINQIGEKRSAAIQLGENGPTYSLTPDALEAIADMLRVMADGKPVVVVPVANIELTIAQAAEFLCVSKEHLNDLLDSGQVAYRQLGRYRMVMLDSLLEYDREDSVHRHAALTELMEVSQEMGLYD